MLSGIPLDVKPIVFRKGVHVGLGLLLLIPYLVGLEWQTTKLYYAILTVISAIVYAIQVRQPYLFKDMPRRILESQREIFRHLMSVLPIEAKSQLEGEMRKLEDTLLDFINKAEREYEKRGGYLGILLGGIAVYIVASLFDPHITLVAITTVVVYDTFSAIFGLTVGEHRLPRSKASLEGCLGGIAVNAAALSLLGVPLLYSLAVSSAAAISEAYSPEDNLTIPVSAAVVYALLLAL